MSVMYVLISISIFVAIIFLILFVKSVKNGQFDDGYTPSIRMLFEDEVKKQSKTNKNNNSN
ncbi:cbb3-type cytochrome oxidase assembly protein CcoS [Myroides ceti]|uniref:Cbb3-type cytochrome oxidase assembly protein CcoS n=1 Tax=Paenimyroides ceti TaxID=395087 RepID=A0ABT8CXI2_9FLAO|nr:cbb3-type cytochrome oxidase assembly protein CcoS [Paenimyroides ceti]MDN3707872.1 cbb3-type cytochrome oxidase assembly protein CcoS [Paenimyroides ceti]MDN3709220.1 cbb3-type cytochrome oxidase assembly protein CcoS [Paenimyroides ceti]